MVFRKKAGRVLVESGNAEYTQSKRKYHRHEENKVQRPIVRILSQIEAYTGLLTYFHVPNQLLRRSDIRKIFAGLGVRAGVPDICIPIGDGKTIWLELKYNGNATSDGQDEYIKKLKALGHVVEIIDAKDEQDAQRQLFELLERHNVIFGGYIHPEQRGK